MDDSLEKMNKITTYVHVYIWYVYPSHMSTSHVYVMFTYGMYIPATCLRRMSTETSTYDMHICPAT
jgi:hypothetical protein